MARANGILTKNTKLSVKIADSFVDLGADLQEFPNLGGAAEQVEVTTLADGNRRYINGIKDFGSLEFTFLYDGSDSQGSYQKLRAIEVAGTNAEWKVTLPDSVEFTFTGQASVAINGGAVNDAITFTLTINLNSDLTCSLD